MDLREQDRLARTLRDDPRSVRPAMAAHFGDELSRLAYVVLQNRSAAESAAAQAIVRAAERVATQGWAPDGRQLAEFLGASALAAALELHAETREVDPLSSDDHRMAGGHAAAITFPPRQRAIAAAVTIANLSLPVAAHSLGTSTGRAARLLADAEAMAGSRQRLAKAMRALAGSGSFDVGAAAFATATCRPGRPTWWKRHLVPAGAAAGAAALAVSLLVLVVMGEPAPPDAPPVAAEDSSVPNASAPPPTRVLPPRAGMEVTLRDCGISADSEIAYQGWLTADQLSPGQSPDPTRPLYVLVTSDTAAWAGPARMAGPPYRPEGGRLGCALDPHSGVLSAHRLPSDWDPPELVDGCPASPFQRFAGYAEIGGPNAFVLLPPRSTSWWARDASVRIMARLSPGPDEDDTVTARARPLGDGAAIELRVDSPPPPAGRGPSKAHYVWLEQVEFTSEGCWVVSLAIDGEEVGSAVLPVTRRPG